LTTSFADYAARRMNATPFLPNPDHPEEQIYAAALTSFEKLAASANGLTNARGERFDLSCGYIEEMTPNAFADHWSGAHVIGMHQALLATIVEFALFVFTQSHLFPQIGDAAGEDSPAPAFGDAPGVFLLDKTLRAQSVVGDTDRHRVPKDADRHIAAIYLALIMTRFVWFHELAHCTRGHVLFLKDMGSTALLHELPESLSLVGFKPASPETAERQRVHHALEHEADAAALNDLCRLQLEGLENITGIQAYDLATRLEMSILGAYLMTALFDTYQRFGDSLHDATHPYPADRLRRLVGFVSSTIAPQIDGFDDFHAGLGDRFNRLTAVIPAMHWIDSGLTDTSGGAGIDLDATLAPFRFG
jgi:hypothetical protein